MEVTGVNLAILGQGLKTLFKQGLEEPSKDYQQIAITVPSTTAMNVHAWLGDLPGMRRWHGDRVVKGLKGSKYVLENEKFEETLGIPRENIEDDNIGLYGNIVKGMGISAAQLPNQLVFEKLEEGFSSECYDGQNFFDHEHPVEVNGKVELFSNLQDGSEPAWYVADLSKPSKPLIFQERTTAEFAQKTDPKKSDSVFDTDNYEYGSRYRCAAGYGLWQLIVGSKAELNATNFQAALLKLASLKRENGNPAGIAASHIIIGESLYDKAAELLKADRLTGGKSNINKDRVKIIKTAWAK